MSRFYNALKEASRWPPSNESGWEGLKPPGEIAQDPTEPASIGEVIGSLEEELSGLNTVTPAVKDNFGTHADVMLDRTARLIPHAVDPGVVEHYRKLRTKIMQQHTLKPFRSLVVTSPNPGEGKSVTALNLGLSFASLPNFRVVVVDGDLRKGSLGRWLGVSDRPGLSNLIDGSAKLEDVVLKSDESPMCFVVCGTSEASPGELLNSANLADQFRRLGEHFDLIIVDSPPVNLITDTQLLAVSCDAVLLVARAFSTTTKALEKSVQDLAPFRIIGTILNGAASSRRYRKYGYYGREGY
jgi:capsular exopolysaccharide synthesis family protein